MASIAIIGPGALGGTIAAWLAQNPGHDITLCVRTPFQSLRVQTPVGELTAIPAIATSANAVQAVDWVIVATKTYDVPSLEPWLQALVGAQTRVAVLQNGVEHVARFASLLPEAVIVPAIADIPASRLAPGEMVQQRLGWIVVPEGQNGADFVALFTHCPVDVSAVRDWTTRAWRKLCLNCAGAVSTLLMRSTGPVWSAEIEAMVRGLVTECVHVGRAEGAYLDDAIVEAVVEGARKAPEGAGNSMYADRLAGRSMELDARNGVIVRLGQKHAIPTPTNALVVALLSGAGSPWIS
ncbi:2-dehydropantoate 2-reductase [Devosia submarina]|uniref:2-dehydropantoate 2-reductase n=1 Tax=Devosia submarina TaxID=1173082 RepID=UPI000D3B26C3|nr:2-dehydropantoate 2-reductase [Devosia submarina]